MIKNTSTSYTFSISDFEKTKQKVLNWAQQFNTFCFLDNHQYQHEPHSMECLLAAGVKRQLKANAGNALEQLQEFIADDSQSFYPDGQAKGWLFGHLGYDLKNELEEFSSANQDGVKFPDLFFFEPEYIIKLAAKEMVIVAENPTAIFASVSSCSSEIDVLPADKVNITSRHTKQAYISIINSLKKHILRGDCYEINFCQEFYAENTTIYPVDIYNRLSAISPNPFSALYRVNDQWLICASPERFIKKQGNNILSQPIKGTAKRVKGNRVEDDLSKTSLYLSPKERSENVMVVDLVRNDLAKICEEGTVQVDELFGIYSFPQVHQLISTVSGELKKNTSFAEIIRATFPMGSMTGAPKKKVMELIEKYEHSKRGIFSGAVGYISPDGDFDFNVVIRSIMYNAVSKYISFQAGSGITFYSDPEKEWEECQMKAAAMKKVLEE